MREAQVLALEGEDLLDSCRELAVLANRIATLQTLVAGKIWRDSQRAPEGPIDSDAEGEPSLAARYGCRNAVELLQHLTGESARAVNAHIRLAREVSGDVSLVGEPIAPSQEHVAAGLLTGRLNHESAVLIAAMLGKHTSFEVASDREVAERCLVQAATGLDFGAGDQPPLPMHADDIRQLCRRWDDALDPDGAAPDDELRMDRRYLNLGTVKDGLVRVNGLITMEAAAGLMAVNDALSNPHRRAGTGVDDNGSLGADMEGAHRSTASGGGELEAGELGAGELGADCSGGGLDPETKTAICLAADTRTAGQKRHDALEAVLKVALASQKLPTLGGAHTTVVVEVREEALRKGQGAAWLVDHEGSRSAISLATVKNMACGANIQAVVRDSLGRIKKLGTPSRTFNAHQRRVIALRDQQCVIPGCTVPSSWCEVHHVLPYSRGGPTHTDNGVLLCMFHHRTIDAGGWVVTMEDGVPKIEPPGWLRTYYPEVTFPLFHKMEPRGEDDMGGSGGSDGPDGPDGPGGSDGLGGLGGSAEPGVLSEVVRPPLWAA